MIRRVGPSEAASAFFAGKKVRRVGDTVWSWIYVKHVVHEDPDGGWNDHIVKFSLVHEYEVLERPEVGDTFRIGLLGIDREDSLRTIVYVDDDCVGYKQPDGKECGMVSRAVFDAWLDTRHVADYTKRGQK